MSFIPLPVVTYSTTGKKEPPKLGLDPNVWLRVFFQDCCLQLPSKLQITREDHGFIWFQSTDQINLLHHKLFLIFIVNLTACWKLKNTDFLRSYTKIQETTAFQSVLFRYDLVKSCFRNCVPRVGDNLNYSTSYSGQSLPILVFNNLAVKLKWTADVCLWIKALYYYFLVLFRLHV